MSKYQFERRLDKVRNKNRRISALLLTLLFVMISLCACGAKGSKVKDYAGYYIYEAPNSSNVKFCYCAINISKDGNTTLRARQYDMNHWNFPRTGVTSGSLSIDEDKALFYNTSFEGTDEKINWSNYFPLIFSLLNDGDILYVDSDADGWSADSYTKVDKDEYDSFCAEHELIQEDESTEK